MKHVINIKEDSNNSKNENLGENSIISITVPSETLSATTTENACVFKVNEDGKVIVNCKSNENHTKKVAAPIKEVIIKDELPSMIDTRTDEEKLLDMFENLPENLSDKEISKMLEFLRDKNLKEKECGYMLPYNVKSTEGGDIQITLVVYNGGSLQLNLPQIPLTLIDANKSIIIAELVDVNLMVNCGKIGVFEITVSKEKLKEDTIALEEWDITFTM